MMEYKKYLKPGVLILILVLVLLGSYLFLGEKSVTKKYMPEGGEKKTSSLIEALPSYALGGNQLVMGYQSGNEYKATLESTGSKYVTWDRYEAVLRAEGFTLTDQSNKAKGFIVGRKDVEEIRAQIQTQEGKTYIDLVYTHS